MPDYCVDALLLGIVDEAAGVDDDNVSRIGRFGLTLYSRQPGAGA